MNTLQHIDLRHLRYFVAAAEHGSFRRAGVVIGVSESGISRRIRSLEEHLGTLLFQRSNGGVCLTIAGQCFLHWARKIVRDLGDGTRDVALIGRGRSGWMKVGIIAPPVSGFVVSLLREFGISHQSVHLQIVEGATKEHVEAIHSFDLDLALVAEGDTAAGHDRIPLWTEALFVALPHDHELATLVELEWSNLVGRAFVVSSDDTEIVTRANLMKRLAMSNDVPSLSSHRLRSSDLPALVAMGRGLAVVSEATTAMRFPGVVFRPIRGETIAFGAIWSPHNKNPTLKHFLGLAIRLADTRPSAAVLKKQC